MLTRNIYYITPLDSVDSEVLRQVRVSNIPIVECNSTIMYDGHITDSMICAGDWKGGKDSCGVCNIFN